MASTPPRPAGASVLEDLPFHLVRTALAFRRFNDRTLHAVGLEPQAPGVASVLHALEETQDCTVSHLIEQTHLPNGTLTGLLDQLENDQCIQRIRNPDDRRSWCIRLTPKGRRICAKLRDRHRLVMDMLGEVLSAGEAEELKRLLARVTARMRDYRPEDGVKPSAPSSRPIAARSSIKTKKPKLRS